MKAYLLSLGVGVFVGSLIGVRQPAPAVVALIGLLGIPIGEQVILVGRQVLTGSGFGAAWLQSDCTQRLF
jgi:XapX domain-containing protein